MTNGAIRNASHSMKQKGQGILNFRQNRLVVEVDSDLTAYYRSLIRTRVPLLKPSWGSHITVAIGVEGSHYQGKSIEFEYSHLIRVSGDTTGNDRPDSYYFLDVFCPELVDIRSQLGLDTYFKLHLTIGRQYYSG